MELVDLFESITELFNITTARRQELETENKELQAALRRIAYFVKYDENRTSEWIINFIHSTLVKDAEEQS